MPNDNILQIDIPSVIRHILPHLICLSAPWRTDLDDLAASAVLFPPAAAVLLFGLMRLLLWPFKLLALVVITLITMLPVGFSVGGTLSSLNYIFPGRHFYQA